MDPYVGEIRMFGGNYAPNGWFFCDGRTLLIAQYEVLYVLIGTTYGGDGQNTFSLPDLRSRIPVHMGTGLNNVPYIMGQSAGSETTTLSPSNMPAHTHQLTAASSAATTTAPGATTVLADPGNQVIYSNVRSAPVNMAPASVTPIGGNQPFNKHMPYLAINFIIAWTGIFPPRN
jgi:microcystin-dependent protein